MVDLPLQPVTRDDSFLLKLPIADADLLAVFFNPDEGGGSTDLPPLRRARPPPHVRSRLGPVHDPLRVPPRVEPPLPASSSKPRASLGRVLDDLGATLLDLVHGVPEVAEEIGGVVIHDPVDDPVLPPHALVLGVGLADPAEVAALLGELGRAGAAALVVRAPVPFTPEVREAAEASGVALLGLSRGAPWAHLTAMLRSLLAEGDVGAEEGQSLGGLPSGDLFAVANAIASLLDAPITIEDRSSRVLAFSGRQDEADLSRVETILGRQVPERYSRILTERGVFRELHRSDRPVFISPIPDGQDAFSMPRVAIAVRAGDEVLGSIWAAVPGPLSEERSEALCESAKLVALHLLRLRAGADVQRRMRADLISSALEGGTGARDALDRLGLTGQRLMVLGVAMSGAGDASHRGGRRRRPRAPTAQRRVRPAPERGPPAARRPRWSGASPTAWCLWPGRVPTVRSGPSGSLTTSWTGWGTGCARWSASARCRPTCRVWPTRAPARTGSCACSVTDAASAGSPASRTSRSRR